MPKSTKIILILAIIIGLAGVTGFVVFMQHLKNKDKNVYYQIAPQNTDYSSINTNTAVSNQKRQKGVITDDGNGWKTYVNDGGIISFRFKDVLNQIGIEGGGERITVFCCGREVYDPSLYIFKQSFNKSTYQDLKENLQSNWRVLDYKDQKLISITKKENSNGLIYYEVKAEVTYFPQIPNSKLVTMITRNYYFEIDNQGNYYLLQDAGADEILDQIVDSFRFINQ